MKTGYRLLSLFLALCLILSAVPLGALAEDGVSGSETPQDPGASEPEIVVCTGGEDCAAQVHNQDCVLYSAPDPDEQPPEEEQPEVPDEGQNQVSEASAEAGEKQSLPLYMSSGYGYYDSMEYEPGQGTPWASFYTAESSDAIVPVTALRAEGSAVLGDMDEVNNTICVMENGVPGYGSIIYETETAVYTFRITVDCGIGSHIFTTWNDGSGHMHSSSLPLNSGYEHFFWFYDAQSKTVSELSIDDLSVNCLDFPMSVSVYTGAIYVQALGLNSGIITYTRNGENYTYPVTCQLPDYAFYTAAERKAENLTTSFVPNESNTLYLMWPEGYEPPAGLTAKLFEMEGEDLPLTVTEYDGYYEITFNAPGMGQVIFSVINSAGYVQQMIWVFVDNGGSSGPGGDFVESPQTVELDYNGTPITVGMGSIWGTEGIRYMSLNTSGGMRYSVWPYENFAEVDLELFFTAMVKFGADGEALAPQELYDAILPTVEFEIVRCINTDGSSQDVPNLRMDVDPEPAFHTGITTLRACFTADKFRLFDAAIAMHFTYEDQEYTIQKGVWYESDTITINIPADEDLSMLSSGDALFDWMDANCPEQLEKLLTSTAQHNWVDIRLPAQNYGVVTVDAGFAEGRPPVPFALRLNGFMDDQGNWCTTMEGMRIGKDVFHASNISFVAPEGGGIGVTGKYDTGYSMNGFGNCQFKDFDIGIEAKGSGDLAWVENCMFVNCDTGVLLNFDEAYSDFQSNGGVNYNLFIDNGVAIDVRHLSRYTNPYLYRFNMNYFIHNTKEFNIETPGTYYCQMNYCGGTGRGEHAWEDYFNPAGNDRDHKERRAMNITVAEGVKAYTGPYMVDCTGKHPYVWAYPGEYNCIILDGETKAVWIHNKCFKEGDIHIDYIGSDGSTKARITGKEQ